MHVLDSSALIDILRDTPRGRRILAKLGNPLVVTTSVCMHELLRVEPHLQPLFDSVQVLSFDKLAASISARLESKLRKKGEMLKFADMFIASICLSNGATLVTTDKDFLRVPGLRLMQVK